MHESYLNKHTNTPFLSTQALRLCRNTRRIQPPAAWPCVGLPSTVDWLPGSDTNTSTKRCLVWFPIRHRPNFRFELMKSLVCISSLRKWAFSSQLSFEQFILSVCVWVSQFEARILKENSTNFTVFNERMLSSYILGTRRCRPFK